jgi:hypothetical protein
MASGFFATSYLIDVARVYQVANTDLADLGFGIEALRYDKHGWPIPRVLDTDEFSA